jgi:hypothetical protein
MSDFSYEEANKRDLLEYIRKGQFGYQAAAAVEGTPEGRLQRFPLFYKAPNTRWHEGRVVLLGDAAHAPIPTVGQGLNMALEDGFSLGEQLAEKLMSTTTLLRDGGVPKNRVVLDQELGKLASAAFVQYRACRYRKTSRMVNISRFLLAIETCITKSPWMSGVRTRIVGGTMRSIMGQLRKQAASDPVL